MGKKNDQVPNLIQPERTWNFKGFWFVSPRLGSARLELRPSSTRPPGENYSAPPGEIVSSLIGSCRPKIDSPRSIGRSNHRVPSSVLQTA
jgi:hypothetical protein